jgi:hypothetical protein
MKITAFIMGIAHPQRLEWLRQTLNYMDMQNFPFEKKIVSIDQFSGHVAPPQLVEELQSKGWVVLLDSHRSRILSMERAFGEIDTEYIFYNEDDVMAHLPRAEDLEYVFKARIDGRECGMISMTLGGTQYDAPTQNLGDLKFMHDNKIMESEEYIIFRRLEEYKNAWFFEFPGLWIKTKLFKDCHARARGTGKQIEEGLTRAYFDASYEEKYYKSSICTKNALSILLEDGAKVNSHCRLLTNLDPAQGNSPLGGHHWY